VRRSAALVVATAGIALGIFVGEHRALRFEHRLADDILRGDQLDLGLLAAKLGADAFLDSGIDFAEAAGEETLWNAVALALVEVGGCGHQSESCNSWESSSTRRWWRPPANPVSRKAWTQAFAMSLPIRRPPSARTL